LEPGERALPRQAGEMGESTLGHKLFQQDRIKAIDTQNDNFFSACVMNIEPG